MEIPLSQVVGACGYKNRAISLPRQAKDQLQVVKPLTGGLTGSSQMYLTSLSPNPNTQP